MKERKSLLLVIGGSIKFFLLNWCEVNEDVKLIYKNTVLNITSPCLLKMTFRKNDLIDIEQINLEKLDIEENKL